MHTLQVTPLNLTGFRTRAYRHIGACMRPLQLRKSHVDYKSKLNVDLMINLITLNYCFLLHVEIFVSTNARALLKLARGRHSLYCRSICRTDVFDENFIKLRINFVDCFDKDVLPPSVCLSVCHERERSVC